MTNDEIRKEFDSFIQERGSRCDDADDAFEIWQACHSHYVPKLETELAECHEAFSLVKKLHIKATEECVQLRRDIDTWNIYAKEREAVAKSNAEQLSATELCLEKMREALNGLMCEFPEDFDKAREALQLQPSLSALNEHVTNQKKLLVDWLSDCGYLTEDAESVRARVAASNLRGEKT
jgi:hypothetical protein